MLRQLIVSVLLFTSVFCYTIKKQENGLPVVPYIFEDIINSTIEGLRPNIPDPAQIDGMDLSFPDDGSLPFVGTLTLENFVISGLKGYQLQDLHLDIIGFPINFTLVLPTVTINTGYNLDVTVVSDGTRLFGDGNFEVQAQDFTIIAFARIDLTDVVSINSLEVVISMRTATFDVTGFSDDEELSQDLTDLLNQYATDYINLNQESIGAIISPIIQDLINEIIAALTSEENLINKKYFN